MELEDSERAQLLLIGSVVVAVAILGTIVLLNIIHVPPDVNAQTDSQSLTNAERVNEAIEDDLQQLTLMHTSVSETGEPLPYVDNSTFDDAVSAYSANYTQLTSTNSATLTSVEYRDDGSSSGVIALQQSDATIDQDVLVQPTSLPYIYVNITNIGGTATVEITQPGDNVEIEITSSTIVIDGPETSRTISSVSEPVEIELIDGSGEIRTDGEVYPVEFAINDPNKIQIRDQGPGDTEGKFIITGTQPNNCNAANCIGDDPGETIDVNPTFHVVYQDANVAYETTFSAFGGDS